MNRRRLLRFVGGGVSAVTAGCLGSGGTEGSPDGTDEPTSNESPTGGRTPTVPREARGRIAVNEVEQLQFDGYWSSAVPEEDLFQVQMIIRNTGDETTIVTRYDVDVAVYDTSGAELDSEPSPTNVAVDEIGPGDGVTVTTGRSLPNPETVASYSISLRCAPDSDGVYCEN